MIHLPRTGNGEPAVVVVIPAVSIQTQPRVFRSEQGSPAQPAPDSSREAKADIGREIAGTYRLIESKTAARTGNGTYVSWRDRNWTVLQFTVDAPDSRPHVLLARFRTRWLRDPVRLDVIRASILACAVAADLALDPAAVAAGLRHLSTSINDQRRTWRP